MVLSTAQKGGDERADWLLMARLLSWQQLPYVWIITKLLSPLYSAERVEFMLLGSGGTKNRMILCNSTSVSVRAVLLMTV